MPAEDCWVSGKPQIQFKVFDVFQGVKVKQLRTIVALAIDRSIVEAISKNQPLTQFRSNFIEVSR